MTRIFRFARDDDSAAIAAIYAPSITERSTSFELTPPDGAEMNRRVRAVMQQYPWLVCETSDGVVGYAYAMAHRDRAAYRWSVDASTYISEKAHRQGIARGLYTRLFQILVMQGFRSVFAGITLPNHASYELHTTMGFREVGIYHDVGYKFGKWHDTVWLERSLADHVLDPPEPVALPVLLQDAQARQRIEEILRSD
ncbi:MAG TPA: GNAT family N-acetyltransferase [Gemmatimonadaceae bacterium]|jgi:phosphinothricin acetyltransferase